MKIVLTILAVGWLAACDDRCVEFQATYDGTLLENQSIYVMFSQPRKYRYNFTTKEYEPLTYESVSVVTADGFLGPMYCQAQGDDEPWRATAWVMADDDPCLADWIDSCVPAPDAPQTTTPFTFLREGVTQLELRILVP